MADLQTVPGTRVAFSQYNPLAGAMPEYELAQLDGGILRSLPRRNQPLMLADGQTHFGFTDAALYLVKGNVRMMIPDGFYFSIPGSGMLMSSGQEARGVIVSRPGYHGYLMLGQLEQEGRLRYIDGCTDSLLIPPIKLGDPCLNLLYFPPGTDQTMHTHPSDRIGLILSGRGECITDDERGRMVTPLLPGMPFCIHTGGHHKFRTADKPMRVLAYHPDSDFGPTDQVHPMINRTMINGVSASQMTEIHTT